MIRIRFSGVHYTITMIRNPQNSINKKLRPPKTPSSFSAPWLSKATHEPQETLLLGVSKELVPRFLKETTGGEFRVYRASIRLL